jgi:hypothetical protein
MTDRAMVRVLAGWPTSLVGAIVRQMQTGSIRRRKLVFGQLYRDRLAERDYHPAIPLPEQVHGGPVEVPDRLLQSATWSHRSQSLRNASCAIS